ncbi:hypothetical protein ACIRPN_09180 [Streptomyces sp. NPDC101230]|uniref:hypothetical protein n=1 Tax=unclassified Streptomyces TaxID=2593676 RepID=UPI0038292D10
MATINLVRGMEASSRSASTLKADGRSARTITRSATATRPDGRPRKPPSPPKEKAKVRLAEVYQARKNSPQNQHRAERIQKNGPIRFEQYATGWKAGRRDLSPSSRRHSTRH